MAVFKCKMCGGTLNIEENSTVAECEFCGTKQTLPKLSDEKRRNLYDRANHFRRNNDYDKAMSIYEQILNEDKTDAEAYWSIVLCRYGIEYVEDPATHKHVPTVNRTQFTSIFADEDYRSAIANADGYQKDIYEAEAKEIDKIQKDILAISGKEAPFDVFICYKETGSNGQRTPDSVLAQDLYFGLKNEGFNVFFSRITLEDKLGTAYEPYIFAALNSAKVMVVLGTKAEHFNAVWVKNEWSRFLALIKNGGKKTIIPAYKDMDPYDLPDEFSHLQAQDMSRLGFMQDLIRGIKKIMGSERSTQFKETVIVSEGHDIAPLLKRTFLFLEDGDFDSADEYCEKVLDINPECAEAYMAKLLVDLRVKTPEQLSECSTLISENSNYVKAVRFANQEYKTLLQKYSRTNAEYVVALNERNRKEAIYSNAIKRISTGNPDGTAYKTSISELQSIIDYKDSKEQVERITQKLERWTKYKIEQAEKERIYAEQERLADERRREQKRLEENRQKRKKKIGIISLIAFIVVALSILIPVLIINSAKSVAEKETDLQARNGLILEEKDGYYIVTGIEQFNENVIVPSAYKGKEVKVIAENAFANSNIKSIEIPTSIVSIEHKAFSGCSNLEKMTLPFIGGGDVEVKVNSGLEPNILGYIFDTQKYDGAIISGGGGKTSAIGYYIPSKLNTVIVSGGDVPAGAFSGCKNITSIKLPDGATSIGKKAFLGCSSMASIKLPQNITSIGESAFYGCDSLTEIVIPDTVTSIGKRAFYYNSNLESITFGENSQLTNIGESAFENCRSLKNIIIPNDVTSIEDYTFRECVRLYGLTMGDSVTSIGYKAFYACYGLTSISLPNSVTSIDNEAFMCCYKLVEVYNYSNLLIEEGDTSYGHVGYYAKDIYIGTCESKLFTDEDGYIVYINENDKILMGYIGNETELILPNYITQIYRKAFSDNSDLISVEIPDSVTNIGKSAFWGCTELKSVVIGKGVITIEDCAFRDCYSLESITIPANVTGLGLWVFWDCNELKNVFFEDTSEWYSVHNADDWENKTHGDKTDVSNPTSNVSLVLESGYWYKL